MDIIDADAVDVTEKVLDNVDSTGTVKIILLDVDGVLLDWATGFDQFMTYKGFKKRAGSEEAYMMNERYLDVTYEQAKEFIVEFNNSEFTMELTPLRDAVEGIKTLYENNYRFIAITSHSTDSMACFRRRWLLNTLFNSVFPDIRNLPTGAHKDEDLEPFRGSNFWWIEDKTENALAGLERGLRCILMHHDFNAEDQHEGLTRAHNWQEIVDIILSTSGKNH